MQIPVQMLACGSEEPDGAERTAGHRLAAQVGGAVCVNEKDILPIVPALGDVMNQAGG